MVCKVTKVGKKVIAGTETGVFVGTGLMAQGSGRRAQGKKEM